MQPIKRAMRGAALLCAALCLVSCATAGPPKAVATEVRVMEKRVRQYVDIPPALTAQVAPDPLPDPAIRSPGDCRDGCFSGKQVRTIIDSLLGTIATLNARLGDIFTLSKRAVESNSPPSP